MSQEGNQLQNQGLSLTHGRRHTELKDLPTREYLDETVVPILTEGLAILGKVWSIANILIIRTDSEPILTKNKSFLFLWDSTCTKIFDSHTVMTHT